MRILNNMAFIAISVPARLTIFGVAMVLHFAVNTLERVLDAVAAALPDWQD